MKRAAVFLAALSAAGLAAASARAQADAPPAVDETTPLFCKDSSGDIKPLSYISLGTVMRRYQARFSFQMLVDRQLRSIRFANDDTDYYISYETQPYRDETGRAGVALLSMHVSLENLDETIKGTDMCYFTEFGK